MSDAVVRTITQESEAGRLHADLEDVFGKMLGHTRRIDSLMILGAGAEALEKLRELEAYLARGLEALSRPLSEESPNPV